MRKARDRIKRTAILALLVCLALAAPASAQVSSNYDLTWHLIGGSGGRMQSAQYLLAGTLGQPLVGTMIVGGSTALCSGFWCGDIPEYRIYLPVTLKN